MCGVDSKSSVCHVPGAPGRPWLRAGVTAQGGTEHGHDTVIFAGASGELDRALQGPLLKSTKDITGGKLFYSVIYKTMWSSVNKGTTG